MIIKGIFDSLKTMFWVSLLLLLILYVCAILVVELIGRADTDVYPGRDEDGAAIDANIELVAGWNNYVYFGTVLRSMYTLFNVVIMAEWPEIGRPLIEKQPEMFIFFVFFIIFTTFGVPLFEAMNHDQNAACVTVRARRVPDPCNACSLSCASPSRAGAVRSRQAPRRRSPPWNDVSNTALYWTCPNLS